MLVEPGMLDTQDLHLVPQVEINLPIESLPGNWRRNKAGSERTDTNDLNLPVNKLLADITEKTAIPSLAHKVLIKTVTAHLVVETQEIAGFLGCDFHEVSRMVHTAEGTQQLGLEIMNFCKFKKRIPSISSWTICRVQMIAKMLKQYPNISAHCTTEPPAIRHIRKDALRKIAPGFPVSLEITPDKKIFAMLKELLGTGRYKRVCIIAEMPHLTPFAHATIRVEDTSDLKADKIMEMHKSEFKFQSTLNSPYIVKMHHICHYDSKNGDVPKIGIIMEYLNKGDLFTFLATSTNWRAQKDNLYNILEDSLSALVYLESLNIHHRDIKPENIFLHEDENGVIHAKVGDFGYAKTIEQEKITTDKCGTPSWCAPEYLLGLAMIREGQKLQVQSFFKTKESESLWAKSEALKKNQAKHGQEDTNQEVEQLLQEYQECLNTAKKLMSDGAALIAEGKSKAVSLKTDIWSMGCILYAMRKNSAFPPTSSYDENDKLLPNAELLNNIASITQKDIDGAFPKNLVENTLMHLNKCMLSSAQDKRPTPQECLTYVRKLRALNAPFV